jgi:hypothetical protein
MKHAECISTWLSPDFGPAGGAGVVLDADVDGAFTLYVFADGPMRRRRFTERGAAERAFADETASLGPRDPGG